MTHLGCRKRTRAALATAPARKNVTLRRRDDAMWDGKCQRIESNDITFCICISISGEERLRLHLILCRGEGGNARARWGFSVVHCLFPERTCHLQRDVRGAVEREEAARGGCVCLLLFATMKSRTVGFLLAAGSNASQKLSHNCQIRKRGTCHTRGGPVALPNTGRSRSLRRRCRRSFSRVLGSV